MKLIRQGSSKDIYELPEQGLLQFEYSDRVSVFDVGPIPAVFTGLGYWRGAISNKLFALLNQACFETAFCGAGSSGPTAKMYPLNILEAGLEFDRAIGRLLPVELIFRFVVTAKFFDRIKCGYVDRAKVERLLLHGKLEIGSRLYPPYVESSTKHLAADVYISELSAAELSGVSMAEMIDYYNEDVVPIAKFLHRVFKGSGFELADGKFEGGITRDGRFILADSISPDELRLIGEDGKSYDKEPVRQWYVDNHPGWVEELKLAKTKHPDDKSQWPKYPAAPPADLVEDIKRRYAAVALGIGAIED